MPTHRGFPPQKRRKRGIGFQKEGGGLEMHAAAAAAADVVKTRILGEIGEETIFWGKSEAFF